jgi:hypothetical protein
MKSRRLLMIVMVLVGFSLVLVGPSWADGSRFGDRHGTSYKSCDTYRGRPHPPVYGPHFRPHPAYHRGWYRHPVPPRYHRPAPVVVKEVHRYKVVERAPRDDDYFRLSASVTQPGFGFEIGVDGNH